MRVRFGGVERRGPAVDLRDVDVTAQTVERAVRDPDDDRVTAAPRPSAGPVPDGAAALHERVGFLHQEMSVATVPAVAAAARSWGATTEYDAALRRLTAEIAAVEVPAVDLAAARERVAETAADVDRLRERVARAGGRVEAVRDGSGDADGAEADLADATRELAERETEYHAAREALSAARERAREARDARERRLRLEDRRGNRWRAARRDLADAYADSFCRAVDALGVPGTPVRPRDFDGPDWAAACAVARLARPGAPVVLADSLAGRAGGSFETASRARAALASPVLLVEV
ncbi:MAG: hypothetical protein ABEH83_12175 [Halobacterium sp.]